MKTISVIMPVFNTQKYIAEAIGSLLAQNYPKLEIIVIDDGSTDNSASIAEQMSATVIRQSNAGVAAARNRGLEAATGELITFLDADDLWTDDHLYWQTKALTQHPDLTYVTSYVQRFHTDGLRASYVLETFLPSLGAAMAKYDLFERIGLFDESLRQGEDLDWFLRLRDSQEVFALIPEALLKYRTHQTNITANKTEVQTWKFAALRKRFKRFAGHPPPLRDIPILELS